MLAWMNSIILPRIIIRYIHNRLIYHSNKVNVITRTLESSEKDRARRVTALAKKVQELLSVTPH